MSNSIKTAPLAQLAEQIPLKDKVAGSIPARGTNKNMLTPQQKSKIIENYKRHEGDTGSEEVQVALLSEEIKQLLLHLKKHKKDFHSKRGLLKMVDKRRKLLNYLKEESTRRYNKIVKAVGLKK